MREAGIIQTREPEWRFWVDAKNRIVSFHEQEGWQLREFYDHDLFVRCMDEYTGRQFRYQ